MCSTLKVGAMDAIRQCHQWQRNLQLQSGDAHTIIHA